MNSKTTAFMGIFGGLFFIATVIVSGFQFPDYSHISQYISEAYAFGSPYGIYLRIFGYIPGGMLLFFFGWNAPRFFEKSTRTKLGFFGFTIFYGLATVLVSIFPCDEGCNKAWIDPSLSQIIHNILSLLTYFFVPVSLLMVGLGLRKQHFSLGIASLVLGVVSGVFVLLLFSDPVGSFIGLFQRLVEGSILMWVFLVAGKLLKGHPKEMVR